MSGPMDIDEVGEEDVEKIFEKREYQTRLLQEAIKDNVVLYLPTGSGKTYIAQMLIKHFGHELEKPFSEGGKRSFFLCTTQALLYQQGKVLQKILPYTVGYFTGADGVDYWENSTWHSVLDKYQVIAFTAQILLNLISSNRIQFRQISVIIFDECHHVESGHPMKEITNLFQRQWRQKLCTTKLMGLTATLLNSDVKGKVLNRRDLDSQVQKLEASFCGRIISSDTEEVLKYSTNPSEELLLYENVPIQPCIQHILDQTKIFFNILEKEPLEVIKTYLQTNEQSSEPVVSKTDIVLPVIKKPSIIKDLNTMYKEVESQFQIHGLNAGNFTALLMIAAVIREQISAKLQFVILVLESVLSAFLAVRALCEDVISNYPKSTRFLQNNTPKIDALLKLLKNYQPDQRTLIFCQRRSTVKMLYYLIKSLAKYTQGYEHIKVDFMVGVSAHLILNTNLNEANKKQDRLTMFNFNKGITNLLIATDVLEEGIDIQSCNLVIKFDPPENTRSYVQSKGRARSLGSMYIMMVNRKDQSKYLQQFEGFKKIEDDLKKISKEKKLQSYNQGKHVLKFDPREPKTYYVDGLESACVSETNAPSLMYYYCQSLQYDHFSLIAPSIYQSHNMEENRVKIVIRMPLACPIYEEIHSEYVKVGGDTIKHAFQNAAFQVCVKLHQMGELTDNLRPINHYLDPSLDKEWYPNYELLELMESSEEAAIVGSSRHKEFYDIDVPSFCEELPKPNINAFYHVINLNCKFDSKLVDTERKHIYKKMIESEQKLAIISKKPLSRICNFPIYERLGEIDVEVGVNNLIVFNQEQLQQLHDFHSYLIRQVLPETVKSFMISNHNFETEKNGHLICPIIMNESGTPEIDWDTIKNCKNLPIVTEEEPSVNQRKNIDLKNSDKYLKKVVIPWHRHNSQKQPYIVTNISEHTIHSRFPNSGIDYGSYYDERYPDITIYHKNQFMLDVKPLTSSINFICPRSLKNKRVKRGVDSAESEFEETLFPELCNFVDIPAVYWIKTLYMPTILYRILTIQSCDLLRSRIGGKANIVALPNISAESAYVGLKKASDIDLIGKRQTYDIMDLKSKARKEAIDHIQSLQSIDIIPGMKELKISDILDDYSDQIMSDLEKRVEQLNIDKNLEELTVMDLHIRARQLNQIHQPLFYTPLQHEAVLSKAAADSEKPYEIIFESVPKINIISIEFDPETCVGPAQRDIYEAVTAHSVNDIVNYERLESLGDSMLKFASSLALFSNLKTFDEGRLTLVKNNMVGNKNLCLAAKKFEIPGIIKIHEISPLHDWTPPRFSIPEKLEILFKEVDLPPSILFDINISLQERLAGKVSQKTEEAIYDFITNLDLETIDDPINPASQPKKSTPAQGTASSAYNFLGRICVNDKVIADVVESLAAVYLKTCGVEGAMLLLQYLEVLPEPKVNVHQILHEPHPTAVRSPLARNPLEHIPNCAVFEERIQYTFSDKSFLLEALTHPTFNSNRVTGSYQRLEFLGDAVIDFLVTAYLYENFSQLTPGQITDVRSALVNNVTFASYSCRIGLHKYLLYDSVQLSELILRFAQHQDAQSHAISDEIFYLIEENDIAAPEKHINLHKRVVQQIDVPKALGDVFEALIGAIYLDSGKCLQKTWYYLYNFMKKEFVEFTRNVPKNAIRMVHELNCFPEFETAEVFKFGRVMVTLHVTSPKDGNKYSFYGVGTNKKNAKLAAAKIALKNIL